MFLFGLSFLDLMAWVVAFVSAISVHEFAHAWVANYLGDPTAKYAGRVTLNPLAHIDPFGALFLILAGFGWGKPVPVNSQNFANPRAGQILTSVAGPLANLALTLLLALAYNFLLPERTAVFNFVGTVMYVNVVLLVFNLLPVFPLDGGNVVAPLLPPRFREAFFHYGPLALFSVIAFDYVFQTRILWSFLGPVIDIVWAGINLATRFGG